MNTVIKKIEDAFAITAKIIEENKSITNVWYQFFDCDIQELREAGKKYDDKMKYSSAYKRMQIQIGEKNTTIFCYSKEVKTKEHIVIEDVIENV